MVCVPYLGSGGGGGVGGGLCVCVCVGGEDKESQHKFARVSHYHMHAHCLLAEAVASRAPTHSRHSPSFWGTKHDSVVQSYLAPV